MTETTDKPTYYIFSEMLGNLYHTQDADEINEKNHISIVLVNYEDTKLLYDSQAYLGIDKDQEIMQGLKLTIDLLYKRIRETDDEGETTLAEIHENINRKMLKVLKISRNSKCICGSNKKYKVCCINKY